jgi:hypothetical protein
MSAFALACFFVLGVIALCVIWCCLVVAKRADQIMADIERDDADRLQRMKGAA